MDLRQMWLAAKPYAPGWIVPLLRAYYRWHMRARCWYVGLWDGRAIRRTGSVCLPPASLRYRVHGSPEAAGFLRTGQSCRDGVEAAVRRVGMQMGDFDRILDFGCGCGRTLLWFADFARDGQFHGTDIDAEAIAWCRDHLGFAQFSVNNAEPSLCFEDETFDLVYAVSVFTQLDEHHQFRWLEELRRVVRPGGLVLVTLHGEFCWQTLDPAAQAQIRDSGFLFRRTDQMKGIFPDWYQTAYHTREYVFKRYIDIFEIVDYVPRGLVDFQDMVVLRRA